MSFDGANIQQFPDILTVSVDFLMRRSEDTRDWYLFHKPWIAVGT